MSFWFKLPPSGEANAHRNHARKFSGETRFRSHHLPVHLRLHFKIPQNFSKCAGHYNLAYGRDKVCLRTDFYVACCDVGS